MCYVARGFEDTHSEIKINLLGDQNQDMTLKRFPQIHAGERSQKEVSILPTVNQGNRCMQWPEAPS